MHFNELHITYPPRINFAHTPTPIQPLIQLQRKLGIETRLWVKRDDLTGSHLSGNKIRKLEFLMADAKSKGATHILTCGGVQSNHCRATALLAAQVGLKCHLLLRGEEPEQPDSFSGSEGLVGQGKREGAGNRFRHRTESVALPGGGGAHRERRSECRHERARHETNRGISYSG